jgi:hypothetical protein
VKILLLACCYQEEPAAARQPRRKSIAGKELRQSRRPAVGPECVRGGRRDHRTADIDLRDAALDLLRSPRQRVRTSVRSKAGLHVWKSLLSVVAAPLTTPHEEKSRARCNPGVLDNQKQPSECALTDRPRPFFASRRERRDRLSPPFVWQTHPAGSLKAIEYP